jgi:CBS domain-containing protein
MAKFEMKEFDDELKIMEELMQESDIPLTDSDFQHPISRLHLKRAMTVELGTPLRYCMDILLARHIGCIVVTENGRLRGIFTERDVLLKIAGNKIDVETNKVDDYMTGHPVSVRENDPIFKPMKLMHQGHYRHVTVVDSEQRPLHVVSIKDIIAYIIDFFPRDILNLPPHPIRFGAKNREGA